MSIKKDTLRASKPTFISQTSAENAPDRRQRKVNQTITRVTEIAWSLFQSTGYENVTMEAISTHADIAKATLYKYFPTKESILDHHFKREMHEQRDNIQKAMRDMSGLTARLTYLFEVEANYLQDKHMYLAPLLKHRMLSIDFQQNPNNSSGMLTMMVMLFQAAQATGEIPTKHSAETLAHYLNAMRSSDLIHWLSNPQTPLHERHQQMLTLFLLGVLGDQKSTVLTSKEST